MIISKLVMNPFGCFSDKEVVFKDGLNVVLGPNEAGKSTMFHAIQNALFTHVKLTKRELREIERFIPIGGNTIFVEISFLIKGKPYILKKRWGRNIHEELRLPDGAVVTGEKDINNYLDSLFPAKQGTFKAVLMTYQTGLSKTIDELKESHVDTLYSLGDILRRVLLETDGVSVDKFKAKLDKMYEEHFSHWDIQRNCPEKDKGVNNPWQKEVGYILNAFYDMERVKKRYLEIKQFEEEFDELNKKIDNLKIIIDEQEAFINKYKKPIQDMERRKSLNLQIEKIIKEQEELSKVIKDWPLRMSKIEALNEKIKEFEKKKLNIEKEKSKVEVELRNREIREKFNRVSKIKSEIDKIQKKINSVRKISREDLKKIKVAFYNLEILKGKLSSVSFDVNIKAKKDLDFFVKSGISDRYQKFIIKSGDYFDIKSEGIIELIHDDWEINVRPDDKDVLNILDRIKESEANLNKIKENYGIDTLEEAEELNREYEKLTEYYEKLLKNFKEELKGDTFDTLESIVKDMGEEKIMRPLAEIIGEYESVKHDIEQYKNELEKELKVLDGYKQKYKAEDMLLELFANLKYEEKVLKEQINKLTPLSEDIGDVDKFVEAYQVVSNEYEENKNRFFELQGKKSIMEEKAPDESVEEILILLKASGEKFQKLLKRGHNILKIREITERILKDIDANTYSGIRKDLENYVSKMTNKRYEKVSLKGCLPEGVVKDDGKILPLDILSLGTKDTLLLSLRLTMANYFLKEEDGFLMMDDPLVNLDPDRQVKAGELLREFAKDKQVIIFTCNPYHAKLLNGNIIEIEYCS